MNSSIFSQIIKNLAKNSTSKVVVLGFVLLALVAFRQVNSTLPDGTAMVVRVADGDTLTVDLDGAEEKIRVLGIDTPEIASNITDAECYGRQASAITKQLDGTPVRVVYDSYIGKSYDKYDRLLAYIIDQDGNDLGKTLIDAGAAYEYTYNGQVYDNQDWYRNAEDVARETGAGLWSECVTGE